MVYEADGARWLHAYEIQQAGTTEFKSVGGAEAGKWMPFEGGAYNGGTWLHEVAQS